MAEITESSHRSNNSNCLKEDCIGEPKSSFVTKSLIVLVLHGYEYMLTCIPCIREHVKDIQEKRGIGRNQRFTFIDLVSSLFTSTYNSCLCIITMIMGLLPLLEGLLNLLRFILDKIIEIGECKCVGEKVVKVGIFIGELLIIFAIMSVITTVILLPIANLIEYALLKLWRLAN